MRVARLSAVVTCLLLAWSPVSAAPVTERDVHCLASTMWGEARGDGEIAMLAVADVVLNRVEASGRSICATVRERGQFKGHGHRPPAKVVAVARRALVGDGRGITSGSLYFTAAWDHPRWTRRLVRVGQLGGQVYYRGEWKP